jgi:glycosyltransferase involved in cell wall biosynthesis
MSTRAPGLPPLTARPTATNHSIAAVIPLYNGAPYIEEAIRSVMAQTVQADEILVVDDGSTDQGPQIANRFGVANLTLIWQENAGQSAARNRGVRHSTSSLIAFLDQDDAWYPHHLQELLKPFSKDRGIPLGWSYSNLDEIDEKGRLVNRGALDRLSTTHPKRSLITCLGEDMFILPSASLISREAFDAVGGFDERLSGYEDDDLFLRMFRAGYDNVYINRSLSKWRIYHSSSSFSARMRESRLIYFNKLRQEFPENRMMNTNYVRDIIAPRFIRSTLAEYERSVSAGNKERMRHASQDLRVVSRYLRKRHRFVVMIFSLVSYNMTMGRLSKTIFRFFKRLQLLWF